MSVKLYCQENRTWTWEVHKNSYSCHVLKLKNYGSLVCNICPVIMLYLPKITVCKTLSEEVMPDTLSKLCVIPSAVQTSAHFTVAQSSFITCQKICGHVVCRVLCSCCCGWEGAAAANPSYSPFPQKTLKWASYLPLPRLLSKVKYANSLELICTGVCMSFL